MVPGGTPAPAPPRAGTKIPTLSHAAFGNGRILGLVSPTSAIEWLCLPRFDSPSIFGRILDAEKGGVFRFLFNEEEVEGDLVYLRNTNVTRIEFRQGADAFELIDFAPRLPDGLGVHVPLQVVRLLRPISGLPRLRVDFDPRPDYARSRGEQQPCADGIEVLGAAAPIRLATNLPVPYILGRSPFVLDRPIYFVMQWGTFDERPTVASVLHSLELTVAGWRAWAKTCALPNFAPEAVLRSALCLKLHANHDTGAIIAATTTSIPEAMGTQRTWDYRYCWLRDAAFVVEALRRLGQLNEGERFLRFLRDVVSSGPPQPVYGVGGELDLTEIMLPHLAGFGGNGYVRIGNAAYLQQQNDLMGELVLSLDSMLGDPRIAYESPQDYFPLIERLVGYAIEAAPKLDTGIWEFRSQLRPYTFSRAMCWAAISRGARMAGRLGHREQAAHWESIAGVEREEILRRAYSAELGFFTQALDGQFPDASNLLLPAIGILDARDPRFVSTVAAYEKHLVDAGLMLRYRNPDDFGETTSAFTICSFWWAEALALMGRLEDAVAVFERLLALANPVGLYSEDVEPLTGTLLGNFPQAYTHVGLIHAAMTIGELLDARDGHVRAWA